MGPLSSFVGRDAALSDLSDLVAGHRLVTITGPGGVGKTRLARELAGATQGTDPGTVRWCHVPEPGETRSGGDVDALLADALDGIATQLGVASPDAAAFLLDDRPTVLVLDECERSRPTAARLAARLLAATEHLTIVATSRIPLGLDGERLLVLDPLPAPVGDDPAELAANPAVRLFCDRATALGADVAAGSPEVGRLVRELDGLPLALELAAARLRTLGVAELLTMLEHRLDLLRRPAGAVSPPQPSMRAVLDASYELLDPEDRRLLRWMSVFPGPVAVDVLHRVYGAERDPVDTLDRVGRLVAGSLVSAERNGATTRYRMLAIVRAYAAEQCEAAGEHDRVRERYVDALVGLADEFVTETVRRWSTPLVARMLGCFDNLAGAIELCLAHDADGGRAFRLYLPLYAAVHGDRPGDVARLGRRLLARWPTGDEPLRAEATAVAAAALLLAGDDTAALATVERACVDPHTSPLVRALTARTRGFAAFYRGDHESASAHLDAAVAQAGGWSGPLGRELSVARAAVRAVAEPGAAAGELIRIADAAATGEEHATEIWARVAAGHALARAGRVDAARDHAERALRLAGELGHPWGSTSAARLVAALDTATAGWEQSRGEWSELVAASAGTGDLEGAALSIRTAAVAALRAGEPAIATALFGALPDRAGRTILPCLFDAELAELERSTGGGRAASVADAIRAARTALAPGLEEHAVAPVPAPSANRSEPPPDLDTEATLTLLGDSWSVTYAGTTVVVRDVKGIQSLVRLLARPEHEVHCIELMDGAGGDGDTGPVIDTTARRQYEQRIRELQAELDEATAHHDPVRAERAEAELDTLVEHLAGALGIGGRARTTGQVVERARSAARWRLRSAIERIAGAHPELGRHLRNSVSTGVWCAYRPERPVRWRVDVRSAAPAGGSQL